MFVFARVIYVVSCIQAVISLDTCYCCPQMIKKYRKEIQLKTIKKNKKNCQQTICRNGHCITQFGFLEIECKNNYFSNS